jgi:membrane-associated phospholipid phosphatase
MMRVPKRLDGACAGIFLLMLCTARAASAQATPTLTLPDTLTFAAAAPQSGVDDLSSSAVIQNPKPQDPAPEAAKPTRGFVSALIDNLGDDLRHMPRRNSIYFLAGGGALALAVHPIDHSLNARLAGSGFWGDFMAPGKYAGATEVQISASIVTYIAGRWRHQPRVQHIGMDLLEAQILAEAIVEVTKEIVRRPRPLNAEGVPNTSGYSFPSGHATVTFASATVFQQHFGWKAAVPTYLLATYVATSRLHDNVHFASDVVFGAATGIVIGRSVTWHGRNTFTLDVAPLPGGLGGRIRW